MKHIYLFRHGQSVYNEKNLLQGHVMHPPLTLLGQEQARDISQKLKDKKIQILYTSPLRRARETAEIVNKELDVPLIEDNRLKEACLGQLEGMVRDEKSLIFLNAFFELPDQHMSARFPGGESRLELTNRTRDFLNTVILKNENVIGICGHGLMLLHAVYAVCDYFCVEHVPNAAVVYLTYHENKWEFKGFI